MQAGDALHVDGRHQREDAVGVEDCDERALHDRSGFRGESLTRFLDELFMGRVEKEERAQEGSRLLLHLLGQEP